MDGQMSLASTDLSFRKAAAPGGRGRRSRFARAFLSPVSLCLLGGMTLYAGALRPDLVVNAIPPTALIFDAVNISTNLAKAQFRNVQARRLLDNGEEKLAVEGVIENLSRQPNRLRDLKLTLIGEHGQASFSWVAPLSQAEIKGGATMNFKTSLSAPPAGPFRVAVEFVR